MGFLDKIFNLFVKARTDAEIESIAKKDKKFADGYADLQKLRDKVERDLEAKGIDVDDRAQEIIRRVREKDNEN